MIMESKKTFPGAGKFDPINSTYLHKIYLKDGGRTLTGYSKSLYYAEMQDKIVCLQSVIRRLFQNGYLEKSTKIEFFLNSVSKENELILTLYSEEFRFMDNPKFVLNERLNTFLNKLYQYIKEKKIITSEIMSKPMTFSENEIFSLSYKRFENERKLIEFVTEKRKEGHAEGLVMQFYREYKKKFLVY